MKPSRRNPGKQRHKTGYQLKAGQAQSLTVRPELRACRAVEGWTVERFMVRFFDKLRTHHERP